MAKTRGADAKLTRLQALRKEPEAANHLAELRQALADKSNFIVVAAAEIVAARGLANLAPDLVNAFERFMEDPSKTDKGCRALIAIVDALNKIDYDQEEVFLRAARHVQKEYRYPKMEDIAAPLRGAGAFGLVRINYHDLMTVLVDLLVDNELAARVAGVQALGESRSVAAIPLLRYKARIGDLEATVTAECLSALMTAAPKESLVFVSGYLDWPVEEIRDGAAFALGESRRPDALDVLKNRWQRLSNGSQQEVLLLAISMTRLPEAIDFLLEILAGDDQATAKLALNALVIHQHSRTIRDRIAAAVVKNGKRELKEQFDKQFGGFKE